MAVAVQTTTTSNLADATTVTLTKPTGLTIGDLMVACIYSDGADISVLSGWTEYKDNDNASGPYLSMQYKIADSSDVAASNFTFTIGTTEAVSGAMFRIDGHPPTSLFSDGETAADSNTDDNYNFSGLTVNPRTNNELVIIAVGASQTLAAATSSTVVINGTNPTWTEVIDTNLIQSTDNYAHFAVYYATQATKTQITDVDVALSSKKTQTDHSLIIATISPQQNATGTFTHLSTSPTFPDPVSTSGVTGTHTSLSVSPTLNKPTASGRSKTWTTTIKS